ncbi:hypothetical protein BDR03DRAFT_972160 [Suillus americanus]|nr:hypothetical protein BDR03DRAFT_972160 [Suillus americanus]
MRVIIEQLKTLMSAQHRCLLCGTWNKFGVGPHNRLLRWQADCSIDCFSSSA